VLPSFTMYRDTAMAAAANSADQKRTRPRGLVPADVSRHHSPETAYRDGRQQRRPFQVRQTRQIGHPIEIGSGLAVQLSSAGPERHSCADYHQTIALGSCKSSRRLGELCQYRLSYVKCYRIIGLFNDRERR